jgi:hypothetical protein
MAPPPPAAAREHAFNALQAKHVRLRRSIGLD